MNTLETVSTSAVVGSAFTILVNKSPAIWNRTRQRFAADHGSISGCWNRNDHGGRERIYFNLCIGPSKLGGLQLPEFGQAQDFVERAFPGLFQIENAKFFPHEQIRFTELPQGDIGAGARMLVHPHGAVELSIPLSVTQEGDEVRISAVEIARDVLSFAKLVHDGSYQRLFGTSRRRKVDWFCSISATYLVNQQDRQWDGIVFEGGDPPLPHVASCPPIAAQGLATETLLGRSQRTDPRQMARLILNDACSSMGYTNFADAVVRSIKAATDNAGSSNLPTPQPA